jgi:preprotein translocase subunit SecB
MSGTGKKLPATDYRLQRVVFFEKSYEWVLADDLESAGEDREVQFGWDWFLLDDDEFSVLLGCDLKASREHPDEIRVTLVGDFAIATSEQAPSFQEFVCQEAPRLLFPYLAHAVDLLTSQTVTESYKLPPFDIASVVASEFRFEKATGMRDLREEPHLAARFGVTLKNHSSRRPARVTSSTKKQTEDSRTKGIKKD